jgi:hypothetical protein
MVHNVERNVQVIAQTFVLPDRSEHAISKPLDPIEIAEMNEVRRKQGRLGHAEKSDVTRERRRRLPRE